VSPSWRPIPEPPEPRPLADSLDRVAASFGGSTRASTLQKVFAAWPELVGDGVAAHCVPRALRDGHLVVAVDEPGWATQLRWLEADLVGRLGEVLGEGQVTRVDVVVTPPGSA
jgi:predicted nucleic acid-binding Zn ribbon protein